MPTIGKVEPYMKSVLSKVTQTEQEVDRNNSNEIVTFDIGGQIFRTKQSTLSQLPGTILSNLTPDHPAYQPDTGHYFFDRNPHIFNFILDAYRNGKTHFPHSHCHKTVRDELQFWGLSEVVLHCCCFTKLQASVVREQMMMNVARKLKHNFATIFVDLDNPINTKWRQWQLRIWYFMEDPNSSIWAKVC